MAASRTQRSAPFASRELNGEVLLEELGELRASQVPQRHLDDCALAMRDFSGLRASEAVTRLKHLASNRFAGQPALASLLVRWAARLKSDHDVPLLVAHFERLALTSALVAVVRRSADALKGRG